MVTFAGIGRTASSIGDRSRRTGHSPSHPRNRTGLQSHLGSCYGLRPPSPLHYAGCPRSQKLALREEVAVPQGEQEITILLGASASRAHLSGPGRAGTGRNMAARTSVLLG